MARFSGRRMLLMIAHPTHMMVVNRRRVCSLRIRKPEITGPHKYGRANQSTHRAGNHREFSMRLTRKRIDWPRLFRFNGPYPRQRSFFLSLTADYAAYAFSGGGDAQFSTNCEAGTINFLCPAARIEY